MSAKAQAAGVNAQGVLAEFFRAPLNLLDLPAPAKQLRSPGFFRFGQHATAYGSTSVACPAHAGGPLPDLLPLVGQDSLPFDAVQIIENLLMERYPLDGNPLLNSGIAKNAYYQLRPFMPDAIRIHLQRRYFRGWEKIPFPAWPVDTSVDHLRRELLGIAIGRGPAEKVPFIWFWPNRSSAALILTHDVENQAGLEFVPTLLGIDAEFEVPASYQLVPRERYTPPQGLRDLIQSFGAEVNIHDLTHAGDLFSSREEFQRQAAMINQVAREWKSEGFRAACMYRNVDWLKELAVSYDMSVPNVAHLEPQRGGCCTVFPYFIGNLVELPLTMTQDFSLFHMLRTYSPELWDQQIQIILEQHGLMSFIAHPDYLEGREPLRAYKALLRRFTALRENHGVWIATPGQVAGWWRDRRDTSIVERGGSHFIQGPAQDRTNLAYAWTEAGRLCYALA